MIKNIPFHVRLLALRLVVLLIPYEFCRIFFRIYNATYFSGLPFSRFCYYLITGLRFDVSAILITNVIFISMSLMPWGNEQSFYRRIVLKMVYMLTNSVAFFFQFGDTVFFPFVYKRSTGDIFKFLGLGGGDDTADVMPTVIKDYWWVILIWIGIIILTYFMYNLVGRKSIKDSFIEQKHPVTSFTVASYIVFMGLIVIGCRGGWQLETMSTLDTIDYAPPHDIPLVMNSPYSIITTYYRPVLEDNELLPVPEVKKLYSPIHSPSPGNFRKLNVVTIIMESMSKEYIGALNNRHKTYTPFLDSLISQSLVFDDAYSDGKKSIEGIPAVVASLPSWMNTAFITSPYTGDSYSSLASLLEKQGYTTAFFHGGHNGSMGFDKFCQKGGFQHYYGMKEYNDLAGYDGTWGIWDELFFQYFAKNLDTLHQPFYAAIFSISSHHPFSMPEKYKKRFVQKKGEMPILKCIEYSDFSLREFFETVSKMPWFDSTLFVITADHAGPSTDPYYSNRLGMYEIPIIFYSPHSNLKGRSHITTQQIDIMPSILDYLHYPLQYFAFGTTVFDHSNPNSHYAINYLNDVYQVEKYPYCLQMVGDNIAGLYDYRHDSMLRHNLMGKSLPVEDTLSSLLKAVEQTYNYSVIHNQLK
jgi:arylsulfatase A-like enzyme